MNLYEWEQILEKVDLFEPTAQMVAIHCHLKINHSEILTSTKQQQKQQKLFT
jgi:hypothetical protein